jgi:peptide/nickel transport system ATP-binding protein
MSAPLIAAKGLSRRFTRHLDYAEKLANLVGAKIEEETVYAVTDVDIEVNQGEVVGLVGESGCGKSTLGRLLTGILSPSDGEIFWKGRSVHSLSKAEKVEMRLAVQMIFQDPMSSLNPRKKVLDLIGEAPLVHGLTKRGELEDYVVEIMEKVGLDPSYRDRYPHQFSGGQRQRIGIARALAVKPELIVCDESVAALDVSIQAQILNLFMELKQDFGLTYLFVSHDLGVVQHISDRVVIMYLGRVMESAPAGEFMEQPNHPYTQALLRELPSVSQRRRIFTPIKGEIPSPLHPPPGCLFHPRCPSAFDRCPVDIPQLRVVRKGHLSACHLNDIPAKAAV